MFLFLPFLLQRELKCVVLSRCLIIRDLILMWLMLPHRSCSILKNCMKYLCHLDIFKNVLTGKCSQSACSIPLKSPCSLSVHNWSLGTSGNIGQILSEILLMSIILLFAYTLWHMLCSRILIVLPLGILDSTFSVVASFIMSSFKNYLYQQDKLGNILF